MPEFLQADWCDLDWTNWISFNSSTSDFRQIETGPGLYRVRPKGGKFLTYIGQTHRDLRERTRALAINTIKHEMPWNGPHRGAPCLWAWSNAENWEYEISATSSALDEREIQGLEAMLFWKYRTEAKKSATCNHGKFHEDYFRPKNRKTGIKGGKFLDGEKNPKGGVCWPVAKMKENPIDDDWMELEWSQQFRFKEGVNIQNRPAVYKIWTEGELTLDYIGQTTVSKSRLKAHSKKSWIENNTLFSVCYLPDEIQDYQLREIEDDLIGAYYSKNNEIPKYQFAGKQ